MTRPGIEPRSPGPLANTLTTRPMSGKHIINNIITMYYWGVDDDFKLTNTCEVTTPKGKENKD